MRFEKEQPVLAFSSGDEVKAVVNGRPRGDQDAGLDLSSPLVGTIFMRTSAHPTGTEERRFSKTGLPQYQEEGRQWTATMRVYKLLGPEKKEVYFAFPKRAGAAPSSHRVSAPKRRTEKSGRMPARILSELRAPHKPLSTGGHGMLCPYRSIGRLEM